MAPKNKNRFSISDEDDIILEEDQFDDSDELRRNRIVGIEPEDEGRPGIRTLANKKVPVFIATGLAFLAIVGVIAVTKYLDRPRSFSPTGRDEQIIIGSDRRALPDSISENIHLLRGKESYNRGYYTDAIAEFKEVVESDATDADKSTALTYIGIIHDEQGKYDRAVEYYTRALRYNDRNPVTYRNMALSYRHMNRYDKAEESIEKALRIDPRNVDNRILSGNLMFDQKKYRLAKAEYQEALKVQPENPSALYNLSMALGKEGDTVSSMEYLKRAAEADGIGKVAHRANSKLGVMFTQMGDYDIAEKYLKRAIAVNPKDPVDRYNLGIVNLKQNEKEKALQQFIKAEELGKEDSKIMENLGEAYLSLKEYDKSLNAYNKLLDVNRRDVRVLSRIAEIFYEKGDLDSAHQYYKKITEAQPGSEHARIAYVNIGTIMDDAQRYGDAVNAYEKALAISPKDDMVLYNLGITYRKSGKPEKAIEVWKKAVELNPREPKPLMAIADYYYRNNYLDMASDEYQKILRRWPDLQEAHFNLGAIYYKRNLVDYAIGEYKKVIELNERNEFGRKAMVNLGLLSTKKGPETEESLRTALGYVQKAIMQKPNDADALFALGVIYYRKEMMEQAIDTFYQVVRATRDVKRIADAYNNIGMAYYKKKDYKRALRAFTRGVEEDPGNEEIRINRSTAMQAYEAELDNR
ncbi:MAG TPA: tetratricopeptide repeat protein [Spirochaetota bacterium]|nr:tetratricopeptide repeat protein [Spirochaetota bacterium]